MAYREGNYTTNIPLRWTIRNPVHLEVSKDDND